MRTIHIWLVILNVLYVQGVEIFITTPVKIVDCRAERNLGTEGIEGTEGTELPTTSTEEWIDPLEFFSAAEHSNIDYITSKLAQGNNKNKMISKLFNWHNPTEGYANWTALHVAVATGSKEVILILLGAGASPNVKANGGRTPMHRAAEFGHTDRLSILLQPQYQANANQRDDEGRTPIFGGVLYTGSVELLITYGAEVNMADNAGISPLMLASLVRDVDTIQVMINAGARLGDADEDGWTALHWATNYDNTDAATLLLENGADKSQRDKLGRTPADLEGAPRRPMAAGFYTFSR